MRPMRAVALAGISLALAGGLPVANTSAAAATASSTLPSIRPLTDQRQCNVGERPRQIVLNLSAGGQRCYGGLVGPLPLPDLSVGSVFSGDYTGILWCRSGSGLFGQSFRPNEFHTVGRVCVQLNILPGN